MKSGAGAEMRAIVDRLGMDVDQIWIWIELQIGSGYYGLISSKHWSVEQVVELAPIMWHQTVGEGPIRRCENNLS